MEVAPFWQHLSIVRGFRAVSSGVSFLPLPGHAFPPFLGDEAQRSRCISFRRPLEVQPDN